MTPNTVYGTWCNLVSRYSESPEADIADNIDGGAPDWRERMKSSGAVDAIAAEYRARINAALPDDVALVGEDFIGPSRPEDGEFEGYPTGSCGALDIRAIVEGIDLAEIVERRDVDNVTVGQVFYVIETTGDGEVWQPVQTGEETLEQGITCADAAKIILDNWLDDQEDPKPSEWRVCVFVGTAADHRADPDAVVISSDD